MAHDKEHRLTPGQCLMWACVKTGINMPAPLRIWEALARNVMVCLENNGHIEIVITEKEIEDAKNTGMHALREAQVD